MRITTKATNIVLNDELKNYAVEKVGSLERFFKGANRGLIIADIELGRTSRRHRKGKIFRCEVNISVGKRLLRAEEKAETLVKAIDLVRDEMEREAKKWLTKRRDKSLRAARRLARRSKNSS